MTAVSLRLDRSTRADRTATDVPKLAWIFVLAGMVTMPWLSVQVGSVTICEIIFASAAYVLLLYPTSERFHFSKLWLVGTALIVIGGEIATARAVDPYLSQLAVLRLGFLLIVGYYIAGRCLGSEERLRGALTAYVVGAAVSGAWAIAQVLLEVDLDRSVEGRASALSNHPNDAGASLAVGVVVALGLLGGAQTAWNKPASSRLRARLGVIVLIALTGVGLLLSASVTGILSAFAGAVALLMLRGTPRWIPLLALALGVAILALAGAIQSQLSARGYAVAPTDRLSATTGADGDAQNTLESRLQTDRAAWAAVGQRPVWGSGMDSQSGIVTDGLETHNVPLLLWFQGGLAAMSGLVLILISSAKVFVSPITPSSLSIVKSALVSVLLFGATAPVLNQVYFWAPLLILAAVGYTSRQKSFR